MIARHDNSRSVSGIRRLACDLSPSHHPDPGCHAPDPCPRRPALPRDSGVRDIKAVMALSEAIQAEYHMPAHVAINNGSHLTVTFPKEAVADLKLSDEDRADFARRVARFAVAHYRSGTSLSDVRIAFQSVSNAGMVTVTSTDAPYTFAASELK